MTIASLKRSENSVWMLSGDNEIAARAVAREHSQGRCTATGKSAFIQELKEQVIVKPRRWGKKIVHWRWAQEAHSPGDSFGCFVCLTCTIGRYRGATEAVE